MTDSPTPLADSTQNNASKVSSNDILSPLLKEPLRNGWRREVVYRSIVDGEKRNNPCDIYYFTPDGKKLRSRPDVLKYLNGSNSCFSIKHFSFFKEPIGMDGDQESCRYAKTKPSRSEDTGEQPRKKSMKKNIVTVKNSAPTPCPSELESNVGTVTTKTAKKRSRDKEENPCSQIVKGDEHQNQRRISIRKRIPPKKLQDSLIKVTSSKPSPTPRATSRGSIPSTINLDDESSPACSVHDCEDIVGSSDEKRKKFESPVQLPSPVSSRLSPAVAPFPETLPLNSPLIGLLPLGTTLVLSDPSTLRIIPPCTTSSTVKEIKTPNPKFILSPPSSVENSVEADSSKTSFRKLDTSKNIQNATSCAITTPVKDIENLLPEIISSPPSSVENSPVADSSKSPFRKPGKPKKVQITALPSVNNRKLRSNKEPATISAPKKSSADGFAVPPSPSDYKNERLMPEFGMLGNQNRSYWVSVGKALIEEGLQKAILPNTSATIGDNPISLTPNGRDVKKTPPVTMTCKEFFALRKQKREQLKQPQIAVKRTINISVKKSN